MANNYTKSNLVARPLQGPKRRRIQPDKLCVRLFLLDPEKNVTRINRDTCCKKESERLRSLGYGAPPSDFLNKYNNVQFPFSMTTGEFKAKLVEIYPKLNNVEYLLMKADKSNKLERLNIHSSFYNPEEIYYSNLGRGKLYIQCVKEEASTNSDEDLSSYFGKKSRKFSGDLNPFEKAFLPREMDDLSDCPEYLQRLDWVQDFDIAEANEECNARHLEIVCRFGKVPRITDLLKYFGEDVLPYVTYMAEKLPEGAEFELFINEDGTLKDVYDTALKSFEWVENYKTGIVITCRDGEVPSMGDLRKNISKDVLPCVEFAKSEHWSAAEGFAALKDYGESDDDGESDEDTNDISSDDEKDTKSRSDLKESDINGERPTVSTLASKETKDLSSYFGKKSRKLSGDLNPFKIAFLPREMDDLSDDCQEYLQRLDWVQGFNIAEANEECNARHLEIVCKFGKVPRITDLLKYFGEDVLPYMTYMAGDDSSWFRTALYDENFDLKDEHVEFLSRLKWVQDFAIAGQNEECDTLHLVITCRRGEVPCMAELKKQFGKEIVFYVEFLPGTDDEYFQFLVNENNHTSASRYPMSGNGIYIHDDSNNDRPKRYGTIGVFACKNGKEIKHYATTCYHVSYNGTKRLPKKNDAEKHRMLCQDSENLRSSTHKSKYCYFSLKDAEKKAKEPEGKEKQEGKEENNAGKGMEVEDKEKSKEDKKKKRKQEVEDRSKTKKPCKLVETKGVVLGKFSWGKFSELHDFSMLEIFGICSACSINDNTGCIITCNRNIKKEIDDELLKKRDVIVKKTGYATATTKGVLIQRGCTIKWQDRDPLKGPRLKNGYLIKNLRGSKPFARSGDSGCIVKLVVGEKIIPFAYLVYSLSKTIDRAKGREPVYFCFDLAKSFEEFTKYGRKKNSHDDTELCLTPCAGSSS